MPVQFSVYEVVAARGVVDSVPLAALTPDQPPEAEQLVAFGASQVSVDDPPSATVVGFAVSVTVGAGTTVTVTVSLALPVAPSQDRVKFVVAVKAAVVSLPFNALVPVQPPVAVQRVEFVEFQVSTDVAPLATLVGATESATVGAESIATLACALVLPPAPVHVSVKSVAAASAPVDSVPLVALAPLQPPEAVQPVAFVEFQVNVEAAPLATLFGFAVRVTVGAGATVTVTV